MITEAISCFIADTKTVNCTGNHKQSTFNKGNEEFQLSSTGYYSGSD